MHTPHWAAPARGHIQTLHANMTATALSYLIAARRGEIHELENLSHTCDLVLAISELIHCLQQERGVSNIFLALGEQRFATLRRARMAETDAAHTTVRTWLGRTGHHTSFSGGAKLYTRIACALHALDDLPAIRAAVTELSCSPDDNTERYTHLVGTLLALIFEAADVAIDPDISRLLIALFYLMQGKELAGRERATGAAAFAAGHIAPEQVQSIDYLIEVQEQAFQRFESFAGHLHPEWRALQTSLPLADLERMRRKLLTAQGRSLDKSLSDAWLSCCTTRMDGLHQVEKHLAGTLQQRCQDKTASLRRELDGQEQGLSGLLNSHGPNGPLSPLTAFSARLVPDSALLQTGNDGVGPQLTQVVVDMLRTQSERLQNLTEELSSVRASIDERKLIERAKGVLMAHHGLNEEKAYRFLRQNAMNQNRRVVEVAQAILSLAEMLPNTKP